MAADAQVVAMVIRSVKVCDEAAGKTNVGRHAAIDHVRSRTEGA